MLARAKVSRPETSPVTPLPQHTSEPVLTVQRQTFTRSLLDKHEKLRRLGEAATDVFCAGIEAIFDKWGTQRMSQRMHRITKSMQNSCGEVFQAPYARLHATLLEQQARVDELSAQLSAEKALPQQLSEQSALIDQLRDAIPVLEQRVSEQHAQIQLLEAQVEESKAHEARVHRQDADITTLVEELDKQRATAEDQARLIDNLRETVADLEDLKEAVAARDATIEDLRQQIIADGEEHLQQVAAHERTVTDLQEELSPLRVRVEEQLSHISELSVEADAAKTHEARVAEQTKLITDLQAMLSQDRMLEKKVNEQDILMTELRGAVSAGEIELDHQREHAALLQRELSGSEKEKTALREKAEKLAADLEAARAQMKEMEAKPRNTPPPPPPRRQSSTLPWYMNRYSSSGASNSSG